MLVLCKHLGIGLLHITRMSIKLTLVDIGEERVVSLSVDPLQFRKFYLDYTSNRRRSELVYGPNMNWRDPSLPQNWSSRYATKYAYRCTGSEHEENLYFVIRTFDDAEHTDNVYLWLCAFDSPEQCEELWNMELTSAQLGLLMKGRPNNILLKYVIGSK